MQNLILQLSFQFQQLEMTRADLECQLFIITNNPLTTYSLIHSPPIHSSTHSFIHQSSNHLSIHSFIYSLIHSSIHSFIHPFIHSFVYPLNLFFLSVPLKLAFRELFLLLNYSHVFEIKKKYFCSFLFPLMFVPF